METSLQSQTAVCCLQFTRQFRLRIPPTHFVSMRCEAHEEATRPRKETLAGTSESLTPRRGMAGGSVQDKDDKEWALTAHDRAQTPPTVILVSSGRLPSVILAINADATVSRGVCGGRGETTLLTRPLSCEPMEDEEAGPRKRQRCGPMGFRQGPAAGQWAWLSATVGSGWAAGRLLARGG